MRRSILLPCIIMFAFVGRAIPAPIGEGPNTIALLTQGYALGHNDSVMLEARLQQYDFDLAARIPLLTYYQQKLAANPYDDEFRRDMRRHQLWLIRNQPRLDVTATPWCLIDPKIDNLGYTRGKEAWIEHTQKNPHDAVVLANAARFIAVTEPAYAERLLKRAIVADPSNPKWHVQMGSLLIKLGHAEMVTDELDTALGLTSELQKMSVLFDAAEVALEAGKFAKAKDYANAAFDMAHASRDPMRGASIHRAHIIEGRIALAAGSVVVARFHLLEAGNTPIPKPLNAFGPNMTLARELLAKGERQAVARYVELCSTWWQPEDDRLIRWKAEIESTGSLSTAPTDQ